MRRDAWRRTASVGQVVTRGYEGLVAKDEASVSVGGPSRDWLKVKQTAWTDAEDRWKRRLF